MFKLSEIHCNEFPLIPNCDNLYTNCVCGTVSKAFTKSIRIISKLLPLSRSLVKSLDNSNKFVIVDLPLKNPC